MHEEEWESKPLQDKQSTVWCCILIDDDDDDDDNS